MVKIGPKTSRFLRNLKRGWGDVKRGYGRTIRAGQEYLPRMEKGFGQAAEQVQDVFAINPGQNTVNVSTTSPEYIDYTRPVPRRVLIKPRKRHDFGKLTFDI